MKKRLRIILVVAVVILCIALGYCVGTGLRKCDTVALYEYTLSKDKESIEIKVTNYTSMGYIRGYKDTVKDGKHYIDFYYTFGGLNSPYGAKTVYNIKLDKNDTEIYFNRLNKEYSKVLEKDNTGNWITKHIE